MDAPRRSHRVRAVITPTEIAADASAAVESRWLSETWAPIDKPLRAVTAADAPLLLDEADALLGRRTEVKDAHDRYANDRPSDKILSETDPRPGPD